MKTPTKSASRRKPKESGSTAAEWDLRLYVAGPSTKSIAAFHNLEHLCEQHLAGRYHIDVIDLMKTPQLARGDQILALPALVRHLPMPIRKVVGDLSDTEQVIVGLDLRARATRPFASQKGEANA